MFVIHKNRGRKSKHTIPGKIRDKIVSLALTKYKGTNYIHLSELLREEEAKGIKSPRKHKPPKPHRIRERKSQEGLLLQMDASPYEWIPGLSLKYFLYSILIVYE